jgi:hypothetical protein
LASTVARRGQGDRLGAAVAVLIEHLHGALVAGGCLGVVAQVMLGIADRVPGVAWFETSPATGPLRIGVEDDGARIPVPARGAPEVPGAAESGYGLDIVAAVAAEWGVALGADDRRVTWCVVPATGDRR